MSEKTTATDPRQEALGLGLGALGVLIFSFTLPITKSTVPVFGPLVVGIGRAVGAAALALIVLRVKKVPLPERRLRGRLLITAAGVVFGFPLFTALALQHAAASRGAIVVGILPAVTALVSTIRHGERPSRQFWLAASGGLITVVIFAIVTGTNGRPEAADGLFLLAVLAAAIGYAEGAAISREIGGWQTISWALVVSLPLTIPITVLAINSHGVENLTGTAILGLVYVSFGSMFLGFFAWYAGLSMAGVARVSQIQLIQPILTLVWSALFLDETITTAAVIAALMVLGFVVATRRAPVG